MSQQTAPRRPVETLSRATRVPTARRRRKAPLAWLPWAALGLIVALLLVAALAAAAADDEGARSVGSGALVGGGGSAPRSLTGKAADADVAGTVLFAEDSAALDPAARRVVAQAAAALEAAGVKDVEVAGYPDVVAGQPVTQPRSEQRASAVARALQALLGKGVTVTSKGYAEADPVASNATEAGRAQNRRAVIRAR